MSPDVLIALFGVTWAAIGFGFVLDLKGAQRITRIEDKLSVVISVCGKKAMSILRSPHTPELDELIDKFSDNTITRPEMDRIMVLLDQLEKDGTEVKGARLLAFLAKFAVAKKKGIDLNEFII